MSKKDPNRLVRLSEVPSIPNEEAESNGSGPNDEEPESSWQPQSLVKLAANPPEPPTIGGLLYPGERTVLSGETESMKTWLTLILAKAEMDIGLSVCWTDLDAMGPGAMLERLQLLGASDEQVDELFLYIQPSEMLDPSKIAALSELVEKTEARLFVIDAFNPILSLHGLDPNSVSDVEKFWRTIADPICHAGAATVLLDHVVKNPDNRGKYASGSERKASGSIVHLGFKLLEPLRKGGTGRTLLSVHKDRPGYLPRPTLGRLVLSADDESISYLIEPDKSHDPEHGFRPTGLMEKMSRYLSQQHEDVSQNQVVSGVDGKTDAKRKGLSILVEEGYASCVDGPNRAKLYAHVRLYIEAEDQPRGLPFSGSPPVRPEFALDLRSSHSSGFAPAPPYRGEGRTRGATQGRTATQVRPDDLIHEYEQPPFDDGLMPYEDDE